jgi:hypothetical protein
MAIFVPHLQKGFKLTLVDGLPQASVDVVGVVHWLRCCPLCGSVHQVQSVKKGESYTPLCQTHAYLYKTELAAWHKLYPDVVQYTSLRLIEKAS